MEKYQTIKNACCCEFWAAKLFYNKLGYFEDPIVAMIYFKDLSTAPFWGINKDNMFCSAVPVFKDSKVPKDMSEIVHLDILATNETFAYNGEVYKLLGEGVKLNIQKLVVCKTSDDAFDVAFAYGVEVAVNVRPIKIAIAMQEWAPFWLLENGEAVSKESYVVPVVQDISSFLSFLPFPKDFPNWEFVKKDDILLYQDHLWTIDEKSNFVDKFTKIVSNFS